MPERSHFSRRDALKALGAGALLSASGCPTPNGDGPHVQSRTRPPHKPWAGPVAVSDAAFAKGVQSGDPLSSQVLLWTWHGTASTLTLHYALWNGLAWTRTNTAPVEVGADGYVHHELNNLPPDTVVGYQFSDDSGQGSPVGQARTATEGFSTIRFGVIACTKGTYAPFPVLSHLSKQPLDFCVHLGDVSYNDGCNTREKYRQAWTYSLTHKGYRDLTQSTPTVITWDDHEVYNNWDRESISTTFLEMATGAFFEALPIRRNSNSELGLWRRLSWGDTIDLFVLDCRGERYPSRDEYLSPEQLEWLKAGLCNSSATWKLIANSVPITNMPPVFDVDVALRDRWEGFPSQRNDLLNTLRDCEVNGVLFLGGDFHMSAFAKVEAEGAASRFLELIIGPSGNVENPLGILIPQDGQFPFTDARRCAAIVELSPLGDGWVELIDEKGVTFAGADFDITGQYSNIWHDEDSR